MVNEALGFITIALGLSMLALIVIVVLYPPDHRLRYVIIGVTFFSIDMIDRLTSGWARLYDPSGLALVTEYAFSLLLIRIVMLVVICSYCYMRLTEIDRSTKRNIQ